MELILFFFWLVPAIASAIIAGNRGRSWFGWLCMGLLFGIFAIIILVCIPSLSEKSAR